MQNRNPFTSISNFSFVRNASHISGGRPPSRSYSTKKYFEYQGSYLGDPYLHDWQTRQHQEVLSSRIMGIDALRYCPTVEDEPRQAFQSSGEYYNVQTCPRESRGSKLEGQTAMKNSTKDMFGSEYFKNRFGTQQDERMDSYQVLISKKPSLNNKSSQSSRFKKQEELSCKEEESREEESNQAEQVVQVEAEGSEDPATLFLKSRGKLYYLYEQSSQY